MYNNNFEELYHHGVLGQKWGVRRYQNPDGSYKAGAEGRYTDTVEVFKKARSRTGEDFDWDKYESDDDERDRQMKRSEENMQRNKQKQSDERMSSVRKAISEDKELSDLYSLAVDQRKNYKNYDNNPYAYVKTVQKIGKTIAKGYEDVPVESLSGNEISKYKNVVTQYIESSVLSDSYKI